MVRPRVFGIVAGHEDCNDHDRLWDEPVLKMVAGRAADGDPLAGQPTLSGFENGAADADVRRPVDFTVATGVERLAEVNQGAVPASVTLDPDAADDPTHGHQQLTPSHGCYGQHQCYPPIISGMTTRHAFLSPLRHGTAQASLGADDDRMEVVDAQRVKRPDVAVHVRGDAGSGPPLTYGVCEANGLTHTLGFSSSRAPGRRTGPARRTVRRTPAWRPACGGRVGPEHPQRRAPGGPRWRPCVGSCGCQRWLDRHRASSARWSSVSRARWGRPGSRRRVGAAVRAVGTRRRTPG